MLFSYFSYNFNYAVGWTVIHTLWQCLVIALLCGIFLLIFRKKPSSFRYHILAASMVSILVSAVITFLMYYRFDKGIIDFIEFTQPEMLVTKTNLNQTPDAIPQGATSHPIFSFAQLSRYINTHLFFIVMIWIIGLTLSLLRLCGNISYVYFLKTRMNFPADEYWQELFKKITSHAKLNKTIELAESALVRSPLVIGFLKPMILFPIGAINRLSEAEVEAILYHELAHIKRHDYLINLIQNIIESFFYYHPAVWWLSSQLRNERENCCDDMAIAYCGNAMTYAKSLVSVQEMSIYTPHLAMALAGKNKKQQLLMRVQRIFKQPKTSINIFEKIFTSSVVLAFVLILGIAARPNSGQQDCAPAVSVETQDSYRSGNVMYLKYVLDGIIDSLLLHVPVNDGDYIYRDHLHDVKLTIKHNHVIQFNINGLEVSGSDIPKFDKLIYAVLESKQTCIVEGPMNVSQADKMIQLSEQPVKNDHYETMYFDHDQLTMIDKNGIVTLASIRDRGCNEVTILLEPEPIHLIVNELNQVFLNDQIVQNNELSHLGWQLTSQGLAPVGGFGGTMLSKNNVLTANEKAIDNNHIALSLINQKYSFIQNRTNQLIKMISGFTYKDQNPEWFIRSEKILTGVQETAKTNLNLIRLNQIEKEIRQIEEAFSAIQRQVIEQDKKTKIQKQTGSPSTGLFATNTGQKASPDSGQKASSGNQSSPIPSHSQGKPSSSENKKNDVFEVWLKEALISDGYAESGENIYYEWNHQYMKVNQKTVRHTDRLNYARKFTAITSIKTDQSFYKTGAFTVE